MLLIITESTDVLKVSVGTSVKSCWPGSKWPGQPRVLTVRSMPHNSGKDWGWGSVESLVVSIGHNETLSFVSVRTQGEMFFVLIAKS